MSNTQFEQKLIELINDSVKTLEKDKKEEVWIIKFKGERIRFYNGKCAWSKKSYAQAAVADKIKYKFSSYLFREHEEVWKDDRDDIYYSLINDLIEKGILEFIKLA